jgi:hypothetical protein
MAIYPAVSSLLLVLAGLSFSSICGSSGLKFILFISHLMIILHLYFNSAFPSVSSSSLSYAHQNRQQMNRRSRHGPTPQLLAVADQMDKFQHKLDMIEAVLDPARISYSLRESHHKTQPIKKRIIWQPMRKRSSSAGNIPSSFYDADEVKLNAWRKIYIILFLCHQQQYLLKKGCSDLDNKFLDEEIVDAIRLGRFIGRSEALRTISND